MKLIDKILDLFTPTVYEKGDLDAINNAIENTKKDCRTHLEQVGTIANYGFEYHIHVLQTLYHKRAKIIKSLEKQGQAVKKNNPQIKVK